LQIKQLHYDFEMSLEHFNFIQQMGRIMKKTVLGLFVLFCMGLGSHLAHAGWEKTNQPPATETPIDLALCAERAGCFYAATSHQVFRNENNKPIS
jgi:hypothetical protein